MGIPIWNDRIAPVFDVARNIRLVTVGFSKIVDQIDAGLPIDSLPGKTAFLVDRQVTVLICGAISRRFYGMLCDTGIAVVPFINGDFNDVFAAWLENQLDDGTYEMPGRCRRRHQCWRRGREGAV